MKIEQVVITPKYAGDLLKKNTKNRPLSTRRAKLLADAMVRGEWVFNGDAIRVSRSGVVLDGQHRLSAVMMSGVSIDAILINGLDDSVFDTIDTGSSRTCGDVLSITGVKNANVVAAALSLYFAWKKTGNPFHGSPESKPTHKQAEQLLEDTPTIKDSATASTSHAWCRKYLTASITTFCMTVFSEVDKDAASEFFSELEDGVFSYASSPVMRLRDRVMEDRADKISGMSRGYKIAIIFKAFKLYRNKSSVKTLRVRMEGDAVEKDLFALI